MAMLPPPSLLIPPPVPPSFENNDENDVKLSEPPLSLPIFDPPTPSSSIIPLAPSPVVSTSLHPSIDPHIVETDCSYDTCDLDTPDFGIPPIPPHIQSDTFTSSIPSEENSPPPPLPKDCDDTHTTEQLGDLNIVPIEDISIKDEKSTTTKQHKEEHNNENNLAPPLLPRDASSISTQPEKEKKVSNNINIEPQMDSFYRAAPTELTEDDEAPLEVIELVELYRSRKNALEIRMARSLKRYKLDITSDAAETQRCGPYLSIPKGSYIAILAYKASGWWIGRLGTDIGCFPGCFVEILSVPIVSQSTETEKKIEKKKKRRSLVLRRKDVSKALNGPEESTSNITNPFMQSKTKETKKQNRRSGKFSLSLIKGKGDDRHRKGKGSRGRSGTWDWISDTKSKKSEKQSSWWLG